MARNDVNIVVKARDEASRRFNKIGKSAGGMGSMFKKAAAAAAVYFGAREIKRFTEDSLRLYGIQETAVNNLTAALDNLGAAGQINEMKSFASDIQRITTYGDEATLGIMSLGTSMGNLSGDELRDATKAAMGLAKAKGLDTLAAMRLVARARGGDTSSLKRYNITIDASLSAQEKFNKLLEIGAKNFKLVEAETDTFAGKVQMMKNALGDVKEKIGKALVPAFTSSAVRITRWAVDNQKRISQWAEKTVAAVTLTKDVFFSFAGYLKNDWKSAVGFAFDSFLTMFEGMFKSAMKLAIIGGKGIWQAVKNSLQDNFKERDLTAEIYKKAGGKMTEPVGNKGRIINISNNQRIVKRDEILWKESKAKAQKLMIDESVSKTFSPDLIKAAMMPIKNAGKEIAQSMPESFSANVQVDFAKFQARLAAIVNSPQARTNENKPPQTHQRNKVAEESLEVLKKIAANTVPKLAARESRFMTYDASPVTSARQQELYQKYNKGIPSQRQTLTPANSASDSNAQIINLLKKVDSTLGQTFKFVQRQSHSLSNQPQVIRSL